MEQNPIKITHIIEGLINGKWQVIDYAVNGKYSAFYDINATTDRIKLGLTVSIAGEPMYVKAYPVINTVIISKGFEIIPIQMSTLYREEVTKIQNEINKLETKLASLNNKMETERGREIQLKRMLDYPMFLLSISYTDVDKISHMPDVDISYINDGTVIINGKEIPVTDGETTWIESNF